MRGQGLGAATGGVWTAEQARAAGLSGDEVQGACERGEWQVLRRGVYLDGGVSPGTSHRAWAAVLSAGGPERAVAVGRTAARLHGLPLVDDDDPATGRCERRHDDVAVARALHPRPTLHAHRWSCARGDLGRIGGCPTTSPLRTLWDLRLVLRPDALVCALDDALHRGLVARADLEELVEHSARVRGAVAFRTAVSSSHGRAESPLETLVRLAVRPVLPGVEPQVEVRGPRGELLARIDLGVRALRLGIEADGGTHHGAVSLAADRARERRTGWTFERVTWAEVRRSPERVRARVAATAERLRRECA